MMFGWMASLGLPLLAGFVAELMLMVAYWHAYGWWIIFPGLVLAITAAYYLWSMQRTIFEGGEDTQPPESLHGDPVPDIDDSEKIAMLLLAAFTILFGVMPWIFLDMMDMWTRTAMTFLGLGGA
jgi:NADH-quinone oxidoreductase subunit M